MGHHFVPVDRSTPFLLPPSLQEWLPQEHLARFVVEVVEQLDLSPLESSYAGRGSKAYHPGMLLAMLFYGYATGVFSSRKLEAASYDSIAFRYICANEHPDHDTIATFRRRFMPQLAPLFTAILVLAGEMGFLKLGTVSLDGTKVKANASKHKALSWGHAVKLEEQLRQEVDELLALAETADREDSQLDIPAELSRREERLAAIAEAKLRIEARAKERHEAEQEAYEAKVALRRSKEKATGKKARGKEPKPPETGPQDKDQVNLTDEESRIMPVSGGGFEQAYNAQAAVDIETHLVVAQFVTQAPNDKNQVEPALDILTALPEELEKVEAMLADNGFLSEANVEAAEKMGIEPMMALGREAHHQALGERMYEPEPPGPDASALERMRYRLKTVEGRSLYGKRKSTVEPVFGQIKQMMGFRQFMVRGLERVSGEWTLVTMAYNIRRLFQLKNGRKKTIFGLPLDIGPDIAAVLHRWSAMIDAILHQQFFYCLGISINRLRPTNS